MSNHGEKEECVPKRRAHAYFIKPTAQAEINTNMLVGSRNSSKDGASLLYRVSTAGSESWTQRQILKIHIYTLTPQADTGIARQT